MIGVTDNLDSYIVFTCSTMHHENNGDDRMRCVDAPKGFWKTLFRCVEHCWHDHTIKTPVYHGNLVNVDSMTYEEDSFGIEKCCWCGKVERHISDIY